MVLRSIEKEKYYFINVIVASASVGEKSSLTWLVFHWEHVYMGSNYCDLEIVYRYHLALIFLGTS